MVRKERLPGASAPVHRISGARRSLSDEIDDRTRKYLYSMAVRTVCFLGAVVAWAALDQAWLGWLLLIGATILPYIAVVIANAGRERPAHLPTVTISPEYPALEPAAEEEGPPSATSGDRDEPRIA